MYITRLAHPRFLFNTDEGSGGGEQAPVGDTPENGHEAAQQTQAEVDWAKRYADLQPAYTQATQEAAQLRQERELYQTLLHSEDQDTRREAAQALGIELAEEEPDDTQYEDPSSALQKRLDALEQKLNGDLQQRQQAEKIAQLEVATEKSMDALSVPADEKLRDWIVSRAVALPPNSDGLPDVKAAWEEFAELENARQKQWASTKRTRHIAPGGGEGTQAPDLSTHQGRVQHMLSKLQADE